MRLSEALEALTDRLGAPRPDVLTTVFGRWDEIVGQAMAAHVKPSHLHDDALVVVADHPAWATQVRHLGHDILVRIGHACGPDHAPARLEVRVKT